MPKGILTRFIVETHPWIEEQTLVWRSGVVLNQYQTRAEVIEKEAFISYAWGGESEEFVNNLDRTLQDKGVKIVRDNTNTIIKNLW
jgi:hypothetical protein